VIGKWIVGSHRPAIRGNVVNLDVKIRADSAACDAVDFAVEVRSGVEIGRNGVRRQACVVGIIDWVVAPERSCRREVLVYTAKQIDVGTIACSAEPTARRRKRSDGCPGIGRRRVLVSVRDGSVVGDAAETINIAAL
jgi:hypothetical protein